MSNAGREYKLDLFDNMLYNEGIESLTSTLHIPQQNEHAEHFMRTFINKSEAIHFTACIPLS
jgi:hypothetical protein